MTTPGSGEERTITPSGGAPLPDGNRPPVTSPWQRRLTTGARLALIVVGLSPLWVWALQPLPSIAWLATPMELWFGAQCHREPGRSLELFGHLLPVCNRCLGIYLGLGLGALFLRPRLGVWPLRLWVGFAASAMILDVWTEALGMRPESAWLRVVTGLLLAYPVSVAIVWTLREGSPDGD